MRYIIFKVRVAGESLWPELVPGRVYWATGLLKPRVGEYAVFRNPGNGSELFVKKVTAIRDGIYSLRGTVERSASFELQGSKILGKIMGKRA